MSLLSLVILPMLEKELVALEPAAGQFLLNQLKMIGEDVMQWAAEKLHVVNPEANSDNTE